VNTPVRTPTVLDNPSITFSFSNNPITKSANCIAIGSMIANKPFRILVNPSVIFVSLASDLLQFLLRILSRARNAPAIPANTAMIGFAINTLKVPLSPSND
jgi:hypothetical protein